MTAVAVVKGGFWPANSVSTLTQAGGTANDRRTLARVFGKRGQRKNRELIVTLLGAAAGSTAADTISRVSANVELGGKRVIESETLVNRATVAGDITELTTDILTYSSRTYDPTPVPNRDGNPLGTR